MWLPKRWPFQVPWQAMQSRPAAGTSFGREVFSPTWLKPKRTLVEVPSAPSATSTPGRGPTPSSKSPLAWLVPCQRPCAMDDAGRQAKPPVRGSVRRPSPMQSPAFGSHCTPQRICETKRHSPLALVLSQMPGAVTAG
jgi:hypothetical protein